MRILDLTQKYQIGKYYAGISDKSLLSHMMLNRRAVRDGVDLTHYTNKGFEYEQLREIYLGKKSGIDVSIYADTSYSADKMFSLRCALEDGIDVSWCANPKYTIEQLEARLEVLYAGADTSLFSDPALSGDEILEILTELESVK